nr:hypothetical protein Iba_chr02dCG2370 [Ipomoea batatas]
MQTMFHQKLVNGWNENSKVLSKSMGKTTKCINSISSKLFFVAENKDKLQVMHKRRYVTNDLVRGINLIRVLIAPRLTSTEASTLNKRMRAGRSRCICSSSVPAKLQECGEYWEYIHTH